MRITDAETMDIVEMVLGGLVNKEIVALINSLGGRAVGLSGKDGNLIRARKLHMKSDAAESDLESAQLNHPQIIDAGLVGAVEKIDTSIIELLINADFIPVIAPIGVGENRQTYNINADLVAGQLAATLGAEKLILLTNTPGVLSENGELLTDLAAENIGKLLNTAAITGGMIPKVECALAAIKNGVGAALIIDGRIKHALLLELLTESGIGTQIRWAVSFLGGVPPNPLMFAA